VFFVLTEPPQKPFHPDRISVRDPEYAVLRGLFFQNVLYANAQDEWVAAPMIIGRSLRARPGAGPRDENRVWVWLGVAGAALVVLALRLVYLYRSLRRRPARRVRPWPEEPDADAPPLPGEAQIDAHRDTDADEPSSGEP
jgi:hypothetical protein